MLGDEAIQHQKVKAVVPLPAAHEAAQQRIVQRQVQVAGIHAAARWLMLRDRVDQGVAGLGVFHEETSDTRGERAEVAGWVEQDRDAEQRRD
mmetsp:Transcript_3498/g.7264  ORF Transcript_3498/g.7264 Transcript_3498/m.7264 type:complete len:92 (+) Transcript_3498:1445-1720(+)